MDAIKKKYGVNELWSFSKYNTYKNSNYEYFLKYIARIKEDRTNCIYAPMGGAAHDILEKYYTGKIEKEEMIGEFEDSLFTLNLSNLKFDRTSEDKDKSIRQKYVSDLQHFFRNHIPIARKLQIEQFITIKIAEHIFQGYMDGVYKDNDGNYVIIDWKTSTAYKGDKAIKEGAQLILYSEGLRQMGIPINKIKAGWNFLKYCNITIEQANGKKVERQIERCKIGESLQSNAKMWLKKLGYEESIESFLEVLLMTNDIYGLPENVRSKYKFNDYYVYLPLTEELIEDLKLKIIDTISEIQEKERIYKETNDDSIFWESPEAVENQGYYFAVLSGYSAELHKPYRAYLEKLKQEKDNKNSLFSGVGCDTNNSVDDNLDWLNEI